MKNSIWKVLLRHFQLGDDEFEFVSETRVHYFRVCGSYHSLHKYEGSIVSPQQKATNHLSNASSNKRKLVNILGLFELSTKWGVRKEGESEILAAQVAIQHINEMNVLPGYRLKLIVNDTRCDPGIGVDRFFYALYSNKNILVLLGSGCSNVTERLANIVPYWNIPQISFGSTSPNLSDRKKFPLFFRTIPPDSSHNSAKIEFLRHFGWEVVISFTQSENVFLLPINNLVKELEMANISCRATITFSVDNYKEQLKTLKDLDVRIILASFSSALAGTIFCEVFHLQMHREDYVWILQDHQESWWKSPWKTEDCKVEQLKQATEGLILVSDVNEVVDNETSAYGLSDYSLETFNSTVKSKFIKYVYDAVWAIALALRGNRLITCSTSKYYYHRRGEMVAQFVEEMESLSFAGLSGPVRFSGPDRVGNSLFTQIQGGGKLQIAVYESDVDKLNFGCINCFPVIWKHGKVPIAQRIVKVIILKMPLFLYYMVCSTTCMGIMASMLFLYFNLKFRAVKNLKLSSPKLNNVAVLGCILVYFSVILMEIDKIIEVSRKTFTGFCTAKAFLLSAGFSLVFGSIFAKTYRVHKLFNNCRTSVVKTKFLKDTHLIALISTPVVVDAIILSLWVVIDPLDRKLHNLTLNFIGRSNVVYQNQVQVCASKNTAGWYFALYGYKGIALIMGVLVAWKNRNVKVPTLNEFRYIGICVYSVIFTAVMLILSNFIAEYVVLSYLSSSCSIIIATSLTLFLLFLPQFQLLFGRRKNDDLLMQSMGLKFECNTRRFIYKDQKELLNRLEIQNRVFKCEIEALDDEIRYLESLLTRSSTSSNIAKSDVYTISRPLRLDLPERGSARASWPTSRNDSEGTKPRFSSENELNEGFFNRFKLFGKIRKFFGDLSSIGDIASVVDQEIIDSEKRFEGRDTLEARESVESLDINQIEPGCIIYHV
ncbi:gamma-aminobutyric acid type B receptor subunit 2 isoform X2 [Coccinella septempunctata]|uniref:gamma-aminobutyric acid type B receptor subunit 2 isoform X2 n=1 Tax=Coccinella septempunctata TaxID=41139 RepID=UPI001D085B2B|nr:gamma-aminobutyric acid type B receptor subunit 2 isoform X2 [Coccinella septempunctata]